MIPIRSLPTLLLSTWKAKRGGPIPEESQPGQGGKGHSLLRLHEYQHRVIVEIFKVSIIGFSAFILVLLTFAIYSLFDPFAPGWIAALLMVFCTVLVVGLYRTVREFYAYRGNYADISARLKAKLDQQGSGGSTDGGSKRTVGEVAGRGGESRLLAALKPKEHDGWDHKPCTNCQKTIELLTNICQHCGQEQDSLLVN